MVTVTEEAAIRLKELMAGKDENNNYYNQKTVGLRIFVQGGGCSGFQYGMHLENEPNTDSDAVLESSGVKVFIDPISAKYLQGTEIDFDDFGGGFKIKNQNATSTCGCGSSFTTE